jgi:protein phosphatase
MGHLAAMDQQREARGEQQNESEIGEVNITIENNESEGENVENNLEVMEDNSLDNVDNIVEEVNEISEEEAKTHPQRSLLLQAIDGITESIPAISAHEVLQNDKLILCSDGLTNVVSDAEILEIINKFDYVGAVSALIEKSLEHGGPDNITVIVADIFKGKSENKVIVFSSR